MASHTIVFTDGIFVLFTFGVVLMILQVFLSKTESKWTGLIMPAIMFGISLIASFQFMLRLINTRSFTGMINGVFIEHTTSMSSIIGQTVLIFVLCNIATGILIAVYTIFRRKRNRQDALEMMSVQDLG
ncbi:MAG: hypothetical protein FWE20_02930 [Defluviitaleaceae bacterium]|nr:hypothetical protein [Defluviitaleaceae bacterium]